MQSEKRSHSSARQILQTVLDASLVPFLAILTAVVVGGIIIRFVGGDPFLAYKGLIQGALYLDARIFCGIGIQSNRADLKPQRGLIQ